MERASQLDNDWKVVGTDGLKGSPLRIQGYLESGYCDVGRGGVPSRRDTGGRLHVEENEVGVCD